MLVLTLELGTVYTCTSELVHDVSRGFDVRMTQNV